MSNGNFEHRLDALGRSLASRHESPLPAAVREGVAAKAAAARTTRLAIGAGALLLIALVLVMLPKRAPTEKDAALLDDIESIRRAVAPVWRDQVRDGAGSPAPEVDDALTPRAGDRTSPAPAVKNPPSSPEAPAAAPR